MTFVIGAECIDILDRTCMDVCPVDCIYTGLRKNYINPTECIGCSACADVCPVDAIYPARSASSDEHRSAHVEDSRAFFDDILPGRDRPLGTPGGAALIGDVGADTALVTQQPPQPRTGPTT